MCGHQHLTSNEQEYDKFWLLSQRFSRAEAIAFYKGERREEAGALQRLMRLVRVSRVLIVWSTMLSLWTHYYRHALFCSKACPHVK